jgi:GAF domain-containing protein
MDGGTDSGRTDGGGGRPGGEPGTDQPRLTFPDAPRLALEETLLALTSQAADVLATQGRLRALLRATAAFSGDLDVRLVLRHVVEAARELVNARYAALGVLQDGTLVEFVHSGMDPETVARIGEPPKGLGLLGQLIEHPEPLRLKALEEHPAAAGFPDHHPPMHSFLGVPIRVHDEVFGNLYLTESARGEFSDEDEQLVTALARSAATAIANSRVHTEVQEQRRWLSASTQLTQDLFVGGESATAQVARHAALGADADVAAIAVPGDEPGTLRVDAAAGALAHEVPAGPLDVDGTHVGHVYRTGTPRLIRDYGDTLGGEDSTMLGPLVIVPLQARDEVIGTLSVARLANRPAFTESDVEHLSLFASHAGLALELDRIRADHEMVSLLLDRDRIAEELHDDVITELFSVGMALQGLAGRMQADPGVHSRVLEMADAIDTTIHRIRATVYSLRAPPRG